MAAGIIQEGERLERIQKMIYFQTSKSIFQTTKSTFRQVGKEFWFAFKNREVKRHR